MATYNPQNAECLVFTFKDGLLSKIAHDLKVAVTQFQITVDDSSGAIDAAFDANSLKVINAIKEGNEDPKALSDADKDKISGQIRDDVLNSKEFPVVRFQSRAVQQRPDGGYDIQGDLSLHGVTKTITAQTQSANGRQVMEIPLHQPDYGITPYKAMMGTLKVQADVRVRITI